MYGEEKYMKNLVLIETLWNVKITVSTFCMFSIFCINRNIVECKVQKKAALSSYELCINRNIVECKDGFNPADIGRVEY